ncbi:MAG: putative multicopper oxidase [Chlamydiales bacterium]|jgi:YfiH family protein|nr:putative multicopper oxidase [Chlamydiales bacterium]
MREIDADGFKWLEFELFASQPLSHATFTRRGGFDASQESACRDVLKRLLNLEQAAFCRQVHGDAIALIEESSSLWVDGADALVTARPHLGLVIRHADCQAALLYDPRHHVAAAVHAGWRGSALDIYGKTIRYLQTHFGCRPEDLLVAISPSLGPTRAQFTHYQEELPKSFWPYQRQGYFDFWQISRWQLEAAGILPEHLQIAARCTYLNPEDYFSYRRNKESGRLATCIFLH